MATETLQMRLCKKFSKSETLFHTLIIDTAMLHFEALFDTDDDVYEKFIEDAFNGFNQDLTNAIRSKGNYSTRELQYFNEVITNAKEEFGDDIIKDKDFYEQMDLYVYMEAQRLFGEMRTEWSVSHNKRMEKENSITKLREHNTQLQSLLALANTENALLTKRLADINKILGN